MGYRKLEARKIPWFLLILSLASPAIAFAQPTPPPSLTDRQALELRLGQFYEGLGAHQEACQHFEAAASGLDRALAEQAWQGLARCESKRKDQARALADRTLAWMADVGSRLLVLACAAFLLFLVLRPIRHRRRTGYLLLPFDDLTGENLGPSIASALAATLREIAFLHRTQAEDILTLSEELDLPSFGTPDEGGTLSAPLLRFVEAVSIGMVQVPLQGLLSVFGSWFHPVRYHISGLIESSEEDLHVTIYLSDSVSGAVQGVWRETAPRSQRSGWATLLQRCAYRVVYHAGQGKLKASSPQSFELFSEGLQLQRAYADSPQNVELLHDAAQKLEAALSLDPDYVLAQYALGTVCMNLGRYSDAKEILRTLRDRTEEYRAAICYHLGQAYYQIRQDWANRLAIEAFEQAVQAAGDPRCDDGMRRLLALSHTGLALACAQLGERKLRLDSEVDPWHEAEGHVRRAQELAHPLPQAGGGAWRRLRSLFARKPPPREPEPDIEAFAYTAEGVIALNRGNLEAAQAAFAQSARRKPDYPANYIHWAEACLRAGDQDGLLREQKQDEAAGHLRRAIQIRPQHEYAHYRLGLLLEERGKHSEAIDAFGRAPNIARAQHALGRVLAEQYGRLPEALKAFQRAVDLNKNLSQAWINLAWWSLEADPNNPLTARQAEDYARRALQIDRGTDQEWHRRVVLGRAVLEQGESERARRELEQAVAAEREPHRQSRYYLAQAHYRAGDLGSALQTLKQMFQLFQEQPKDLWHDRSVELIRQIQKELHNEANR